MRYGTARALGVMIFAAALARADGAAAHPHVFIDSGVDFLLDDSGRLAALRVTWLYDPLTSLFMLEDLGLDAADDAALTAAERAALARYQTSWIPGYAGDSYLLHDGAPVDLSGPRAATAALRDGRVEIAFLRDLAIPVRPGPETVVEVYDPTYYTAYSLTEPARIEGPGQGCRAEIVPFEPTPMLARLQQDLLAVPPDGTPEDPQIGRKFAERVFLRCG